MPKTPMMPRIPKMQQSRRKPDAAMRGSARGRTGDRDSGISTLRVMVFSRTREQGFRRLLKAQQRMEGRRMREVARDPDVIVCFGGDGTLLLAESRHPGVPKLLVRRSRIGNKAHDLADSQIIALLQRYGAGRLDTVEEMKLQATIVRGKQRIMLRPALNDLIIRNTDQTRALRFRLEVGGRQVFGEAIGDGLVIATPFGSTGYFSSITGDAFTAGIGVALNNIIGAQGALLLDDDTRITVTILREKACISSDVGSMVRLEPGDRITVAKAAEAARIIPKR